VRLLGIEAGEELGDDLDVVGHGARPGARRGVWSGSRMGHEAQLPRFPGSLAPVPTAENRHSGGWQIAAVGWWKISDVMVSAAREMSNSVA